ncbi:MAG TPA: hypothetical protein VKQ30_20835 [Ktedonobacterales bacterium]|nr:hypothetical protein [Ktedonobacterales bacterium]
MEVSVLPLDEYSIHTLTSIAREIALDINPLETILKTHQIPTQTFRRISKTAAFQKILSEQVEAWNSSLNISERLRIKQAAMVEASLEHLFERLIDKKESLAGAVELFKALSRNGGIGVAAGESTGERVKITINMGADAQLQFKKDAAPKMIEGEVL